MNVEEFCDKLRSLRDKNCEVFISRYCDKELEKLNRHPLWLKENGMRCDDLAFYISWTRLIHDGYKGQAEVSEEGNNIVLRLDDLTYKISVFVPAKLEDILD
jgi:hypothetical protein